MSRDYATCSRKGGGGGFFKVTFGGGVPWCLSPRYDVVGPIHFRVLKSIPDFGLQIKIIEISIPIYTVQQRQKKYTVPRGGAFFNNS